MDNPTQPNTPPIQPLPQTPITPSTSWSKIIFFILLGLILITGLFFVGIQISKKTISHHDVINSTIVPTKRSPTINPTLDWKVLVNENGYSIKYPSYLKVIGEGADVYDEKKAMSVIISQKPGPLNNSPALHIDAIPKAVSLYKNMTLAQISKKNYDQNLTNKNTFKQVIDPYKLITFNDKPAYTYTIIAKGFGDVWGGWYSDVPEKLTAIETENDGKYFIIVYDTDDIILATTLFTFKFTDATNSTICQNDNDCDNGYFCMTANCIKNCQTDYDCKGNQKCKLIDFFSEKDNPTIISKKGCE